MGGSQLFAGQRVKHARPEEEGADHEEGDVEHELSPDYGATAYTMI